MMFEHSISRNQKNKGSKVKTILKLSLILAVAVWLLYQMRDSYIGKTEYSTTDDKNAYLGRKGKAGSENVIVIDTHVDNSDEITETEAVNWVNKLANRNNGNEESQEDTTNDIFEERQHEKVGTGDDNADSHSGGGGEVTNNDLNEGKEEGLQLPSQWESLDQNDNRNGLGDSLEQNELPKDNGLARNFIVGDDFEATSSVEESIKSSDNQVATGESTQNSDHDEIGNDLSDEAVAGTTGSSSSVTEDASNIEGSANDHVHEREIVEFQVVDLGTESTDSTDSSLHDESLTSGPNNVSSTNTETIERDIIETKNDNNKESDTNEKPSMQTANSDTVLEGKPDDSSVSTKGNDPITGQSNDTAKTNAFESRVDNSHSDTTSEEEKSDIRSGDGLVTDDKNNVQMQEVDAQGDASDSETTPKNASDEKEDQISTDEVPIIPLANEVEKIAIPTEDAKVKEIGTLESNASDTENTDNSLTKAMSERGSEDEVGSVSKSDEQNKSQIPTDKTPEMEVIESQGVGVSETQSTSDDSQPDWELAGDGVSQAGLEGNKDSESSSSVGDQNEFTDLKAAQ